MAGHRTNARIAGILLIIGTLPILIAMALWGTPLTSPGYLGAMAEHSVQVRLFALTVMIMGLACAGIGIALYPVLKPHSPGLALAAAGFRLLEAPLQMLSALGFMALLALSQEFARAGSPPASFFQPAGAAIKAVNDWMGTAFFAPFCIGAASYYIVFFRARLVPRWLSIWGLAGLALMFLSSLLGILGVLGGDSALSSLLCFPILVQEQVLAVRLIVRGFDETAVAVGRS